MNGKVHGEKRSRRQHHAIAALLEQPTIAAAADQVGVSESTMRRWMQLPGLRADYDSAAATLVPTALGRLAPASNAALQTLVRNLTCGTPSVEVSAARTILATALQALLLSEMEGRLDQLEAAVEKTEGIG